VKRVSLLVDGMAYVYRAYYAIPAMANQAGVPTNATFGFARMLQRMVAETAPDYLAVAFDSPEPTFRHERFPEYKAHRPPMPDDLVAQLPWIKQYVQALNVACLEYPGFEADDVIATCACRAAEAGVNSLIATADKDLCQLVNDQIAILNASFQACDVLDAQGVTRKFGVRPDQIVDYLVLVGDSADNIPGVQGIGPKTAARLLSTYETLERVFAHLDELKPRVAQRLRDARDTIAETRSLVDIECNVPVQEELDDLAVRNPDAQRLAELRHTLGFRVAGAGNAADPPPEPQPDLF
jgi:DNA polymerase-1